MKTIFTVLIIALVSTLSLAKFSYFENFMNWIAPMPNDDYGIDYTIRINNRSRSLES